jgi:predicted dehydrogenase
MAAGVVAASVAAPRHAWAAARKVRHAVIGLGGQGHTHARIFNGFGDCEVVAVCDVDPRRRLSARKALDNPGDLMLTADFFEILDRDDVDSVSIVTADHWHTPIALHALSAGKHVYVEKPCGHNMHECEVLVDAARATGKCVQHGTQSRSSAGIREAVRRVQDGVVGKVRLAKAINHQLRGPIGRAGVEDPPEGVDYDRWLGPAPAHAFTKNRWHYNWHWFWDYGCGDIGNDGIHQLDQVRWGMGVGMPKVISGSGGQLFYDDDHETPDTQNITFEYDDVQILYEMRLWTPYKLEGHDNGVVFYGDEGTVQIGRDGCFVHHKDKDPERIGDGADIVANMRNFVDAVQADDPSLLMAPIAEGAISANLCHMGNIVTRTGKRLVWDADAGNFGDVPEANALIQRTYRAGYELPVVG